MLSAVFLLLLLLCCNASSAFQQHPGTHQPTIYFRSALGSHPDGIVDSSHPSSTSVTSTRQAFLAKALIATSLPSLLLVNNAPSAFADDAPEAVVAAATYAYRSGGLPSLRPIGTFGLPKLTTRYEGYVEAPKSYSKARGIPVAFDFPSDWLQLDKLGGGVQYVDQRNGDKLYVLRATLPEGKDLKSAPKQWFADSILSPDGDVAQSGVVAEGGRVSRSQMIVDCTAEDAPNPCMARRRLILKYDTVTGNGVQTVERRGLVEAYQVEGDVYMMLTTSNAVKFEQKGGKERETVDSIVASFKIGDAALA